MRIGRLRLAPVSLAVAATIFALAMSVGSRPAPAAGPPSDPDIEPGVILVRFRPQVDLPRVAAELAAAGAVDDREIPALRIRKMRVPAGREREIAARLAARPDVEFAVVSPVAYTHWVPNDALYGSQWALPKIGAEQAWNVTKGSPTITVAVLDTGFDVGHPDSPANLVLGTDYVLGGVVSGDPFGHGTHVAGTIAANTDNVTGVAGLAPGVTLLSIRVLDMYGVGPYYNIALAIREAANAGAKVVNLSLGGVYPDYTGELSLAVQYALDRGVLVVASAGNCGDLATYAAAGCPSLDAPMYPAAIPGVLAVAATTVDDTRASYSNSGSYVGIAAPGGDNPASGTQPSAATRILSLYPVSMGTPSACYFPTAGYCTLRGTSMAAPHVSALAGLILSRNSTLSPNQVVGIIRSTANPLGQTVPNEQIGYGRIDAAAALAAVPPPMYFPLAANAAAAPAAAGAP